MNIMMWVVEMMASEGNTSASTGEARKTFVMGYVVSNDSIPRTLSGMAVA